MTRTRRTEKARRRVRREMSEAVVAVEDARKALLDICHVWRHHDRDKP